MKTSNSARNYSAVVKSVTTAAAGVVIGARNKERLAFTLFNQDATNFIKVYVNDPLGGEDAFIKVPAETGLDIKVPPQNEVKAIADTATCLVTVWEA